jgi:acyl carrier protein
MEEVLASLKAFVALTYLRDASRAIGDDDPLVTSGVIDSFGLVDLSFFIEDTYGVRVDASDLGAGRADTPRQIADLVVSRMK